MQPKRTRLIAAGIAAAVLVLLPTAGAGASTPTPAASSGSSPTTFTVGIMQDLTSLNPFAGYLYEDYEMYALMYDTLVGYCEKDFSPVPRLAESWQESEDKKTWTYKIRSGATWSDGVPLTAKDAAYTFNRIIQGGPDSTEQVNYGNYVANMRRPRRRRHHPGAHGQPANPPHGPAGRADPAPARLGEDRRGRGGDVLERPGGPAGAVGSGPFSCTSARPASSSGSRRTRSTGPARRRSTSSCSASSTTRTRRPGPGEGRDRLRRRPRTATRSWPWRDSRASRPSPRCRRVQRAGVQLRAPPCRRQPIGDGHPALKDHRVRRAIAHAIDQQTLLDKVYGGLRQHRDTVIPPIYTTLTCSRRRECATSTPPRPTAARRGGLQERRATASAPCRTARSRSTSPVRPPGRVADVAAVRRIHKSGGCRPLGIATR